MPPTNTTGGPSPITVENTFVKGLKTEFTGLNFPENACTETFNCVFSHTGRVTRREGIDYELNATTTAINRTGVAINTYRWLNVAGNSLLQILVVQVGTTLYFYKSSAATIASPLSTTRFATLSMSTFVPSGGTFDGTTECQFSDGNGYLFVYNPVLEPFYCTYSPTGGGSGSTADFPIDAAAVGGAITGTQINVQVRDFQGFTESVADNFRPTTLSPEHQYNLINQGWGANWTATSSSTVTVSTGTKTFVINSSILPIPIGGSVTAAAIGQTISMSGTVISYVGMTLTINVTSTGIGGGGTFSNWIITPSANYIVTWYNAVLSYPSNSDVWWDFKNTSNVFDPTSTINNVTVGGPAPKGSVIMNAFKQDRSLLTSVAGLTIVSTTTRPKTGTWFQGRVWFAGVDAFSPITGDAQAYSWSENLYFSQIIERPDQFGKCYQVNDPSDQNRFDLLPTDGGMITIQGSGSIYKLFPVQNGMLVFAGNGIWFITGSQGIGFAATDYTITKISAVRSIASTSFVDVQGWPMFWNEEGIYNVVPGQSGGLSVNILTYSTIASFYDAIPLPSRKYVRGAYNPLTYTVQWAYKTTQETSVTDRYQFDGILNFHVGIEAFFPWTISSVTGSPFIHDIKYIQGPGGSTTPSPVNKYLTSIVSGGTYNFTFSEERDNTNWVDFKSAAIGNVNYVSDFITGFRLHGSAIKSSQPEYVMVFSGDQVPTKYKIQSLWNFAANRNSGKFSSIQLITVTPGNFLDMFKRHRLRGMGIACQFKVTSVDGQPFDIIGWSTWESFSNYP